MNRLFTAMSVAALAVSGFAAGTAGASAGVAQSAVVSANPADFTPNLAPDSLISHPAAYALEQSPDGATMYVGGQFDALQDAALHAAITRPNFAAFSATTGAISATVAPVFNGPVWAIRAVGTSVYAAGAFTSVNGTARLGLVKLVAATGQVDTSFVPPWKRGIGYDLAVVGGRVIVGGTFPGALLALNSATGVDTSYLKLGISGTCVNNAACGTAGAAASGEPTHVYRFAVNSTGTRLVAIGNFAAPHPRAFMVDLGSTAGSLDPWYYPPLANACALPKAYPAYLRGVDFSPDGTYFVIAATGYVPVAGGVGRDVCDAAARFETATTNPYRPTWINYTGGDTLHSVVITGAAVYVQGHQRWLNNAAGRDNCPSSTPCVARPGIGAIDPVSGLALAWNPTKTRNVGGKNLLSTSAGVWVASDGSKIGHEYHYGIALMPLP